MYPIVNYNKVNIIWCKWFTVKCYICISRSTFVCIHTMIQAVIKGIYTLGLLLCIKVDKYICIVTTNKCDMYL